MKTLAQLLKQFCEESSHCESITEEQRTNQAGPEKQPFTNEDSLKTENKTRKNSFSGPRRPSGARLEKGRFNDA